MSKRLSFSITLTALVLILTTANTYAAQLSLTGLTEAFNDAELGLAANGRIVSLAVKEGDHVEQGDLLLSLDQDIEELEVERRRLIWKNRSELNAIKRQVQTLREHLKNSLHLYQTTGSVPREELENKELELNFAVADLERLKNAEAREKVEYESAVAQLKKRNLYAPFAGTIAEVMTEIGEISEIDSRLLRLVNTTSIYFIANVEPQTVSRLKIGQKAEVSLHNGIQTVSAELIHVSPRIDPASGLRRIKALIPNASDVIVPGIAGTMLITTNNAQESTATE